MLEGEVIEAYETDEGPGGEVHVFAITGTGVNAARFRDGRRAAREYARAVGATGTTDGIRWTGRAEGEAELAGLRERARAEPSRVQILARADPAEGGVWTRSWRGLDEPIADAGLDFEDELETIEPD